MVSAGHRSRALQVVHLGRGFRPCWGGGLLFDSNLACACPSPVRPPGAPPVPDLTKPESRPDPNPPPPPLNLTLTLTLTLTLPLPLTFDLALNLTLHPWGGLKYVNWVKRKLKS